MNTLLPLLLLVGADPLPGTVVTFSPAASKQYIGSPGLAVLPNGKYVASHDFFGPGSTKNKSVVFGSDDQGKTWTKLTELQGQWWSNLFVHKDALYIFGTTKEYGHVVVRKSTDDGKTWSTPSTDKNGLLLSDAMYHTAPVPVVVTGGRVWRAVEEYTGPKWGAFKAFVMSAPEDADLLDAKSWTSTNRIAGDNTWRNGNFGGWLEGNVVKMPDGSLENYLRVQDFNYPECIARCNISADGKTLSFDKARGFMPFPGGAKKFSIRYDATTKKYWSLVNHVPKEYRLVENRPDRTRNTLELWQSDDAVNWKEHRRIIQNADVKTHGYQYVEWLFDGADIIAMVRTAHEGPDGTGAHNAHDANQLLFVRIKEFRK